MGQPMSKANERQVSGTHYSAQFQHWDWVEATNLGYCECQITRYVMRWYKKDGIQDLEKAIHYLDKLLELEAAGRHNKRWDAEITELEIETCTERMFSQTQLPEAERVIVTAIRDWTTRDELEQIKIMITELRGSP